MTATMIAINICMISPPFTLRADDNIYIIPYFLNLISHFHDNPNLVSIDFHFRQKSIIIIHRYRKERRKE